jgi:two-component system LytT family sensor kinase
MLNFTQNNKNNKLSKKSQNFLQKIASIDFDKFYTKKVRLLCHVTLWVMFTLLIISNLYWGFNYTFLTALVLAVRSLICNMAVFYLFFYLIIPYTLFKGRIFFTFLSILFIIPLWLIVNYYFMNAMVSIFTMDKNISNVFSGDRDNTIFKILSFKNISIYAIQVLYSISPVFFTKIVFDITQIYANTVKLERQATALQLQNLSIEKDFLKAQLNPHFLFNTLNNLYGLTLRKDNQAPYTIMQLSGIMRYTLYESNAEMVLLSKEIAFLKNYVSLEKMRYKADRNIIFHLDDSQVQGQMVAPLLTFTFIENSFKYGLQSKNGGFLKIDISILNNFFYFSIINDKDDNLPKQNEYGGIGISNVRKRLELLYAGKYELTTYNNGGSYYVFMKINLN